VHELLTRHAQGKRRGRAEQDGAPDAAHGATNDETSGLSVDGPGREDRR
jgi:hypothetical protein